MEIYNMKPKDNSEMMNLFSADKRPVLISESDRSQIEQLASEKSRFVMEELGILMQGNTKEGDTVYFCFAKEGEAQQKMNFAERFFHVAGAPGTQKGSLLLFVLGKDPQMHVINRYADLYYTYLHCLDEDDICYGEFEWLSEQSILSYRERDNRDGEAKKIFYYFQGETVRVRIEVFEENDCESDEMNQADHSIEERESLSVGLAKIYVEGKWDFGFVTGVYPEMPPEEVKMICDDLIAAKREAFEKEGSKSTERSVFELEYEDLSNDLSEEIGRILPEDEFDMRDIRIISLRLGLDDLPRTCKEIALEFNTSEDYIRTIDAKLLECAAASKIFDEIVLRLTAAEKNFSKETIKLIETMLRYVQQVLDRNNGEVPEETHKDS